MKSSTKKLWLSILLWTSLVIASLAYNFYSLAQSTKRQIEMGLTHLIVWFIGLLGFLFAWRHQLKLDVAHENIRRLALYDGLTGLPNRHLVNKTLNEQANHDKNQTSGLILFDIDNFKLWNDTLGHVFGDKLLQSVTKRLTARYSKDHFIGRLSGKNTCRIFHADMLAQVTARTWLEKDLRTAVLDQAFFLFYQPQVDEYKNIIGAEALIRWRHPKRGLISPLDFLPMAEETGLILPIGQWVLTTACQTLQLWQTKPLLSELTLAVNVSAHQFYQADFVDRVIEVLKTTQAPANRLKLELTESLFVANIDQVMQKMSELKLLGIQFSLDDFGTGYSSLSYLKRLPLDQLKIDQSFVCDISVNSNDVSIVKMIVALSNELNFNVIAEGVEREEQQTLLASLGCRFYQGYLFGRPQPLDEFEQSVCKQ
ncbi:bifunctional diguanylate cyclase/phosphodiesterase [Thiomicrospira sp. R3]|uniref:putative bifunctional diguanylate cyclase/phosphodiesterase n=1 Tax=Thiomicrospira sp. R3 TaxID=3035472 RepID=UPI00259B7592|nr:bifunctional diguanylate cyclase/phosphodiesterase [Thiomicrospira sp. R3]WFE69457.1 bifunctional diguanylate cyclase/phosphodiesterase [Thiomicrospira sp. R3]